MTTLFGVPKTPPVCKRRGGFYIGGIDITPMRHQCVGCVGHKRGEEEVHELKFEEMLNVKELHIVRHSVALAAAVPVQWRIANHRNETLRWLAKAAKNGIQERNFAFSFIIKELHNGAKRYKLFTCVCFSLMNLPQRVPYPPGGPGHAHPNQMHPDQTSHRSAAHHLSS